MDKSRLFLLLALFYGVLLVCAGLLHHRSGFPPYKGGGVLDQFNASMLWATSIMALLVAAAHSRQKYRMLFWLCISAGFGALAIDEAFEFHENTKNSLGDDDYIKILALACAYAGVWMICRVARPTRDVVNSLLIALAFQTLWLLSDLGDGDFFTVPIPFDTLAWLEEYFEIMASQFYLTGFILHHQDLMAAAAQDGAAAAGVATEKAEAVVEARSAGNRRVAAGGRR